MSRAALQRELAEVVGPAHVLTDPGVLAAYETDWTRRWHGRAGLVVRPGTTAEVAAVVTACAALGVPVLAQGGNTGLVGGSVPAGGEVVLATTRLRRLDPVDRSARQVTAGAGVPLGDLHRHAAAAGLTYGVDLAARDTATVGGTVATNAGGIRVLRYGSTRAQVLGLEAVLADGSVLSRLGGLAKEGTGYDLSGLLVGSEGTLGVVTAARLRLHPRPGPATVILVGCSGVAAALELLPAYGVRAAEIVLGPGMDLVCRVTGLPAPLSRAWPAYLLLETDDVPELPDEVDAAVDPRLWAYRERLPEAVAAVAVPHKLDVALPLGRLGAFLEQLPAAVAPHEAYVFGHLAEGNLHVNVVGPPPEDDRVDGAVLELVAAYGGSVSAEHGIGRAKRRWLHLSRSPEEISAMRRVKAALDPGAVLAPGVLLPD